MLQKCFLFLLFFFFCHTVCCYLMTEEDNEMLEMNFHFKYFFWSGNVVFLGILRHIIKSYDIVIPYSVVCILVGILWGVAALYDPWMYKVAKVAQAEKILYHFPQLYSPIVIFTTAFSIDTHIFYKSLTQIFVISVPVSLLCAVMTGFMMELMTEIWNIYESLIFGIITVCIYPMDVLGYLKESNVQTKYIISLLHGETLLVMATVTFVYLLIVRSQMGWMVYWYQYVMCLVRFLFDFPIGYILGRFSQMFMKFSFNSVPQLMLLSVVSCFVPYFFSRWVTSGGIITTVIVGIMMGSEKGSLSQESQDALNNLWKLTSCGFNGILFIMVGVRAPSILYQDVDFKDYILVFVTYLVSNISRFLSFFFFSPLLKRLGYGLSFQHLIICVWCGLKNPLCLVFALELLAHLKELGSPTQQMFLHILGLYLLMMCINGTFLPVMLRALGLAEISVTRLVNMNNCIKYVYEARTKTIAILKMDRFLSDANWPIVLNTTALKHPYKKTNLVDEHAPGEEEDEEEDFFLGYRFTYCPDCQKHIPNEPTPKEFKEMTKEAKQRVLKLKKTIYSRQYETAMLTKEGVRLLHQAVELALDSEQAMIELDGLLKMFDQENRVYKYCRNQLQILLQTKDNIYKPPWNKLYLVCYHAIHNRFYPLVVLCVVLSNMPLLVLNVNFSHVADLAIHSTFAFLYFVEVWIRMFALSWRSLWRDGIPLFFKNIWDVLLFMTMLLNLLVFVLTLLDYDDSYDSRIMYIDMLIVCVLAFRVLGLIIVSRFITRRFNFPTKILKYIDLNVNKDKALALELGKNYIAGEEEILENLVQIIDNLKIRRELKEKTELDRHTLSRKVALAQKERPALASTVKAKAAIRTVLNSMKDDIYELKVSGWVDDVEYNKLLASLAERYKYVSSMTFIEPSSPKLIFLEVPYIGKDDFIIDFLWANISTRKYDPGGVVLDEGEEADGVYILITGLFLVNYIPNETVTNVLKESGALPVIEFICSNTYQTPAYDYFIPGNTLGELSTLTGRTYDGRISAETHSEAYFLSAETVRKAIEMDQDPVNGFECRMWKTVAFRTAVEVMMNVPAYRSMTHDKIRYFVERAFVPDLSNYKIFVVNDKIHDVLLVEGVVVDYNTRDVYTAPCYIPRAVQKLVLPASSLVNIQTTIETKLMIIPAKDFDEYEVMITEEQVGELVDQSSSKCLANLIKDQLVGESKVLKHKAMSDIAKKLRKKVSAPSEASKSITFGSTMSTAKESKTSKNAFDD